jgi:hypothetical protein
MTIRITTRHGEDFDICAETVEPGKSPYARNVRDYTAKVMAFHAQLGVRSAMWTTPEAERPKYLERCKPVEYLLEVDEGRVVAYVDELSWSDYLYGRREDFDFSKTPRQYAMTSILISTPIEKAEVKAIRRYRCTNGPDHYELAEEMLFSADNPFCP